MKLSRVPLALLAFVLLSVAVFGQKATGTLKVYMLNVGQGDAIYIECPEAARHNMLIDSGDTRYPGASKAFKAMLQEILGDQHRIDVVVATHPHSDHIGSLRWVIENFEVGTYIDDGMEQADEDKSLMQDQLEKAAMAAVKDGMKYLHATQLDNQSDAPDFCPATNINALLVKPKGFGEDNDPNNNSVVIRLNYNDQTFLFTGDCETEEEELLLDDPNTKPLLSANVFKSPHHGSDTSSSKDFLAAVHPTMFIVSAGAKAVSTNAGYRHPRAVTIQRYKEYTQANGSADTRTIWVGGPKKNGPDAWSQMEINAGIYVTQVDETILLTCDGKTTTKAKESGLKAHLKGFQK